MNLLTLWPWPLTFELQNSTTTTFGYPEVIPNPYTKFEHFGIIRFWVTLRTNKQTDKQMDSNILPTPTHIVRVGNNNNNNNRLA